MADPSTTLDQRSRFAQDDDLYIVISMTNQKIKNKNILYCVSGIIAIAFSFSFLFSHSNIALADDTDCEKQCRNAHPDDSSDQKDCIDNCQNLEKKAQVYQDLIDLKNKQQDTLSGQLDSINQQQAQNQTALQSAQKQLENLNKQISELERSIQDKEAEMESQKKILAMVMQTYYEYDQQGILDLILLSSDITDTFIQSDYAEQTGTRASDVLGNITKARNELLDQKNELNAKREESNKVKETLADKKDDLELNEQQKQSLLEKTQGEEAKYRDLLANVEEQKKELFNFSNASNIGEVSDSVKNYPKPKDHLASTSWYFSQRDSRWGNKKIGNSNSLMKDYGCAVTSVSMIFKKKGSSIDPGKMASQKIFYYDLIKWPTTWSPGITLSSSISHGNISWSTVDKEIAKGNPVIVYIGKTNRAGGHYVVITGKDSKDYIVHDPYFGPNLYLGTSKALVGKIGADSGVKIDQMIIYH